MEDAKRVWVDRAREALVATARTYNALIEYGELAEAVQAESGIRTKMLVHYWIGDVLGRVSRECHRRPARKRARPPVPMNAVAA